MNKHYDDIPIQGVHRGEVPDQEQTTSVRAPMPSDVTSEGRAVARTYVHVRHEEEGWQRVSLHEKDTLPEPTGGTTELGRYTSNNEIREALARERNKTRYIVMENTETGEISYHNQAEFRDDLMVEGRFNQFTIFENQEQAAAYTDRQQKARER